MTERESLERAVLREPEDDTVRLAYADCLEENAKQLRCVPCHGEAGSVNPFCDYNSTIDCPACKKSGFVSDGLRERAEFIRVQIRMSNCPDCQGRGWYWLCDGAKDTRHTCDNCRADRERDKQLFDANVCRWEHGRVFAHAAYRTAGDYNPDNRDEPNFVLLFRRGFVDEVRCLSILFHGGPRYTWGPSSGEDRITSRSKGIDKELFSTHPLTRVVLTDMRSVENDRDTAPAWHRKGSSPYEDTNDGNDVDEVLWPYLIAASGRGEIDRKDPSPYRWIWYKSAKDANEALSRACVAYGRDLFSQNEPNKG